MRTSLLEDGNVFVRHCKLLELIAFFCCLAIVHQKDVRIFGVLFPRAHAVIKVIKGSMDGDNYAHTSRTNVLAVS